jgi:hypothetical protein
VTPERAGCRDDSEVGLGEEGEDDLDELKRDEIHDWDWGRWLREPGVYILLGREK